MPQILVVFCASEGRTAKITYRIADVVPVSDIEAEVCEVAQLERKRPTTDFDGVIIGGSLHGGKHSPRLSRFVADYLAELNTQHSGFFSVSLSAAGNEEQQDAERCLQQFLDNTLWQPSMRAIFASALLYSEYGFFKRWLMNCIVTRAGGETDTSTNYEYTDWNSVETFATDFLRHMIEVKSPESTLMAEVQNIS
jgi:menaquinone-dependent protoporphyrinogen oxidase